jgi:N-acetylglutamate synthase-like GNAT family acetyltransferase
LLHTAITWAKEKAIEEIYLGTTAQFITAHHFYEKHGFHSTAFEESSL